MILKPDPTIFATGPSSKSPDSQSSPSQSSSPQSSPSQSSSFPASPFPPSPFPASSAFQTQGRPDISAALKNAGILKDAPLFSLPNLLSQASLDVPQILNQLEYIITCSESDSSKIRAAELVLRLHGLLKTDVSATNPITIVINDPSQIKNSSSPLPSMVFPREMKIQ
jgi:hypothetical protein